MEAEQYFKAYHKYFWQWEEDGNVIAIPGSSTIAYREFMSDVLQQLYPQKLPTFGSLLMAIAATNPGGSEAVDVIFSLLRTNKRFVQNPPINPENVAEEYQMLNAAIDFLKLLSRVPEEYKTGTKRILLLQAIFWDCHNPLSGKESAEVARAFKEQKIAVTDEPTAFFPKTNFVRDVDVIYHLSKRFKTSGAIIRRISATHELSETPELPPEDNATITTHKTLIEQLEADPKTFYVGSLVKQLWSGLNIPVHSSIPSQQPLGGVSDLSNKGDFDKLLISEFANDDLVFLSRLANNEALYLQREIPPSKNLLQRVILVDTTLKSWGTPKAIALAATLAIANHPKTNIPCTVFAVGNSYRQLAIATVTDIIDNLLVLDGGLHCATGLQQFLAEYKTTADTEIILITEATTIKNPYLYKVLSEAKNIVYRISTDAQGNIDIYKRQKNSTKHLQHMQLPLVDLWKNPPRPAIAEDIPVDTKPGFSSIPLLFKPGNKHKFILRTGDGCTFAVTGSNILLRWNGSTANGWELMIENLPVKPCMYAVGYTSEKQHIFAVLQLDNRELSVTNLVTGKTVTKTFDHWKHAWPAFIFHENRFYHKNESGTWAIDANVTITEVKSVPEAVIEKNKQQAVQTSELGAHSAILKNINAVFINEVGNLVFNVHEMLHHNKVSIVLEKSEFQQRYNHAQKNEHGDFCFDDGSYVRIHKAGAFILRSSDSSLPDIFIASAINKATAVSTNTHFAGNPYYYKSGSKITTEEFYSTYIDAFIRTIKAGRRR